jgi:hypothetical protein
MITRFTDTDDALFVYFSEDRKHSVMESILKYIYDSKPIYCYIYFGYCENNLSEERYTTDYPELLHEYGAIMLKGKDVDNVEFISDVLRNYQMASLYVSEEAGLDKKYGFEEWRNVWFSGHYGRYAIMEMREDYMIVKKSANTPEWDFEKIGIVPELEHYEISELSDTPQDFHQQWKKGALEVEYFNLEKVGRRKILMGNISVNKKVIPGYRFGGPFLYSQSSIIIPSYFKSLFCSGFNVSRIRLFDNHVTSELKIKKIIFLNEVVRQNVFYYTDLERLQSDYEKIDGIYGT